MATSRRIPRVFSVFFAVAALASTGALMGCQGPSGSLDDLDEDVGEDSLAVSHNPHKEGKRLFEKETFGGNGRTCLTCHSKKTGTVSPEDAQERFAEDPGDPLFVHDGSDDFEGNGVSRMLADATVLVRLPLPPNVTLADDPTATSIVVRRGIPTTLNTPALDPVLMYDGRAPDLESQALDAVHGHAESTVEPTAEQLELIAEHQKTKKFFSSDELEDFADGGCAPGLPQGHTAAEKRGRKWFEDAPLSAAINQSSSRKGLCAVCHSGPMLNTNNGFNPLPVAPFPLACTPPGADPFPPGSPPLPTCACNTPATQVDHVPAGTRFQSVLVSELNEANNPVYLFAVQTPGGTVTIPSPDPGRALITGNFATFPVPDGEFSNFKIPTLRGVKKTAPYFHDNSAKSLHDVVEHYATFFKIATDCNIDGDPPLVMTAQDKSDLVAFLKLL